MDMEQNSKDSIEKTKQGFEESFKKAAYYDMQTQDASHLEAILSFLPIRPRRGSHTDDAAADTC